MCQHNDKGTALITGASSGIGATYADDPAPGTQPQRLAGAGRAAWSDAYGHLGAGGRGGFQPAGVHPHGGGMNWSMPHSSTLTVANS